MKDSSPPEFSPIYPLSNHVPLDAGRMALVLGYEGAAYRGWQAQKTGVSSVQATLETALAKVANAPVEVVCAGRTDAGVNATAQVVHFDCQVTRSPYSWVMGGNHHLPRDITLLWAGLVPGDFHARYSATGRTYRYLIYNHPVRPAWAHHSFTWIHQPLSAELMDKSAQVLLGERDFSAFRGADCQSNTPFRYLSRIEVSRRGVLITVEVEANAFLHHMVRNIVGTLLQVGAGKNPPDWVSEVLASKDRTQAGITAPAQGLYLVRVDYPKDFGLPVFPKGPFFMDD